jgi:hypothetical protein
MLRTLAFIAALALAGTASAQTIDAKGKCEDGSLQARCGARVGRAQLQEGQTLREDLHRQGQGLPHQVGR